jgi:hypothetical protein
MLLKRWTEALRHLGGTGATHNAHVEVDGAARAVSELDAQLRRVTDTVGGSRQAA